MLRFCALFAIGFAATLIGCSNSAPMPAARVPAPAAPTPPIAGAGATAAPIADPAVPGSNSAVASAAPATAPAPDLSTLTREELAQKMDAVQQRAFQLMGQSQAAEGYKSFQESAKYARELRRRFPEATPKEKASVGLVLYNDACALAVGGNAAGALTSLKEATAAGFADINQLDNDADLATVRALPEYDAWRKELEAVAAAHAKEEVKNEMASFKSYDFDFTLADLNDNPVKLADLKGKVVVVDFWGTWCPPCRAEIPSFVKLQSKYGDKGLQIIGLGYERGEKEQAVQKTRDFMKAENMNYICLLGDETTQKQVPEFQGYPTTLFIDRTGKVRLQYVGLHPYTTLEAAVTLLLDEPGA